MITNTNVIARSVVFVQDEQWVEGIFDEVDSEEYLTKVDKGVQL